VNHDQHGPLAGKLAGGLYKNPEIIFPSSSSISQARPREAVSLYRRFACGPSLHFSRGHVNRVSIAGPRALFNENPRSRPFAFQRIAPMTPMEFPICARRLFRRIEFAQNAEPGFVGDKRDSLAVTRKVETLDIPRNIYGQELCSLVERFTYASR